MTTQIAAPLDRQPVPGAVQCLSPLGLHTMRYVQWGDPNNPRVLICVHGLTRHGRDFDRLAHALSDHFRVVCPDVVGRGLSDRLSDPKLYGVPQYLADMVSLVAQLRAQSVSWVGTSMGGLIGMALASLKNSPVSRLVLNDVGPRLQSEAMLRIASYVGEPRRFATLEQAHVYCRQIFSGFGLTQDAHWQELTLSSVRPDQDGWVFHYDPAIAEPMKTLNPAFLQAMETVLWQTYDAITCPTLLVRGAQSDLLTEQTAQEMCSRGPRARLLTIADTGHAPMFFEAGQISALRSFLLES